MAKINNTSTVTYKYTLPDTTVKSSSANSNFSSTENMTTSFTKVKSANKTYAMAGDEIQITLVLTNNSDYDITDISIKDTIDTKATFKPNSLMIDGTTYNDYDPITGFELIDQIDRNGGTSTIEYTVTIADEIDNQDVFNFISDVTYSVNEVTDLTEKSNLVTLQLVDPKITITKTADKQTAVQGDTINYTNIIKNDGNIKHSEVRFSDQMPAGVSFVAGSVKVNDVEQASYDPTVGFDLGELDISSEAKVEFAVTVE